jgi:protease I
MSKPLAKPLLGTKIALLAANGFNEQDLTIIQRALLDAGANMRIVSPEQGLVHSWNGEGWGHHYAIDAPLGSALGADFSMLVVPGGVRSMDKLKLTAHTKRFIGSFMASGKPVVACGDAINILVYTDNIRGRTVTGPDRLQDIVRQAGGQWSEAKTVFSDANLLTGVCADDSARRLFAAEVVSSFVSRVTVDKAA